MRGPESLGVGVAMKRPQIFAANERRVADDELSLRPFRAARVVVTIDLHRITVRPQPRDRLAGRVAREPFVRFEHSVLDPNVAERLQDRRCWRVRPRAEIPLKETDPQHEFRDGRRAWIDLQPKKLVRIDVLPVEPRRTLLSAERL